MTKAPELKVTGGTISGSTNADGDVVVYKGIPFAAPPVGDLRWKAPQPVEPWEGVRACTEYSAAAVQPEQAPFMMWSEEFIIDTSKGYSEDCLYLNVWAPAELKGDAPVILYIHGGGNTSGGASCDVYDGEAIAKKGVVYVDCNYRVGIFGFLAATELSAEDADGVSGNYALKDLLAALEWIQTNIKAFGGDPTKVTIAGQSAGSLNVNQLTVCPKAKGLFSNAVTMSYNLVGSQYVTLAEKQKEGDAIFAGRTLKEMRALSQDEVQALSGSDLATAVANYNIDGVYVQGNYDEVLASGKGLNVNVMSGMVTGDSMLFGSFLSGASALNPTATDPTTVAEYEKAARDKLGDLADQFLAAYPVATDSELAAALALSSVDANVALQFKNAAERKKNGDANVFVYLFTHVMPGPEAEAMGAFHTADVPYWFNHFSQARAQYWTDVDYKLGDTMSNFMVSFATTGDPNSKNTPAWTEYGKAADGFTYMELGDEVSEQAMAADKAAFWKAYLKL
ncbi:MAG: carboxylesterase family protein [Coriobacteriales bacterium]|nr:carboxylesterase family protein [Coriobacteriales bacterium]